MQWLISRAAARGPITGPDGEPIERGYLNTKTVEVIQHLTMCRERSAEFRGREDTLRHLRAYLQLQQQEETSSQMRGGGAPDNTDGIISSRPLVVYGQSGSGKTAVMAKVRKKFVFLLHAVGMCFFHSCFIILI